MTGRTAKKTILLILLFTVMTLIPLTVNWWNTEKRVPSDLLGVMRPEPKELTPFTLIDQENQDFSLERFGGGWSFVFFGYTSCPDICPTTLATLASVSSQLKIAPERTHDINTVFVSVDPARDTPDVLAKYMTFFDAAFTGVTGEKQEIDNLVRQFGGGYAIEPASGQENYLVSHTSTIFLVDPEKRLVAHFPPPHVPETIISLLDDIQALY